MTSIPRAPEARYQDGRYLVRSFREGAAVVIWLVLLSGAMALALTVALFDRTTLAGVSRLWIASAAICALVTLAWWAGPRYSNGRLLIASYQTRPLLAVTLPIAVAAVLFTAMIYASDEVHNYVYQHLHYTQLTSRSELFVNVVDGIFGGCVLFWLLRTYAQRLSSGDNPLQALISSLSGVPSLIPVGIVAFGLLLSTATLSMINVNFWRYWATADGWTTIGRYPYTLTDALHVAEGGVAPYFISFPLLPAALVASYNLVGHNTLGSYIPIIIANTLLPLGVFLTVREITRSLSLGVLFAALVAAFPLLRNYTMDVGEADPLLMTSVVFAAYFRLRADRPDAGNLAQVVAGVAGALAALARAEGILYVGAMYGFSMLRHWRNRRFWLSTGTLCLLVGVFALVCLREFGMIWPGNHSATITLANFTKTADVVAKSAVFSMYAAALGIPVPVLAALVMAISALLAACGLQMLRRDIHLAYMPALAVGNVVMVFFVGPIPAEASKFHDFFRHLSYGFPLLAVTLAYGLGGIFKALPARHTNIARFAVLGALAIVVWAEVSLLEGPVNPTHATRSPLMTSDVHVTITRLLADPYLLPTMKFRLDDNRYIPDAPEYLSTYPDDVYRYYEQYDVRRFDSASTYFNSAALLFLACLLLCVSPKLSAIIRVAPGTSWSTPTMDGAARGNSS